jgi:hypothetical protein
MVSAHPDAQARETLTERLMALPNNIWLRIMKGAAGMDSLVLALRFRCEW